MTREEAVALLERYSNYDGMGIQNLAGCKEAMRVAVDALKEAYPGLAESEDEKIRKRIYGLIYHNDALLDKDELLAWLEKQKDLDKMIVVSPEVWDKAINDAYENGKRDSEKQKEQKPVECLKAERDGWYVCIKDYYRGGRKRSSVGDLVQAKGGMHIMGEEDISEWFRKAYYEEVRDAFGPNTDRNIPEKPEWDEEDKKLLDFWLDVIDRNDWRMDENFCKASREFINRLKSLRPQPQWKPSEGQMKALKAAMETYDGFEEYDAMKSLYEQLKKLL